jgi:hypothetical protein
MRMAIPVIFAIALGGFGSDAFPQHGRPVTPQLAPSRESIDLALTQSALENGQLADRFDFSRIRELWVRMRVAGIRETTLVHLTLVTPSGSVFYETTVAYSADPRQDVMTVPNAPHPITVFRAQPARSGHALLYVVPVAGTALARYPSPGRWRINATIDGAREISTEFDVTYAQ